ncbi:MAG: hypothetical protein AAFO82_16905, partial [Bacteroidota bacterium]
MISKYSRIFLLFWLFSAPIFLLAQDHGHDHDDHSGHDHTEATHDDHAHEANTHDDHAHSDGHHEGCSCGHHEE